MWKTRFEPSVSTQTAVMDYSSSRWREKSIWARAVNRFQSKIRKKNRESKKTIITPNLRTENGFFLIKTFRSVLKICFKERFEYYPILLWFLVSQFGKLPPNFCIVPLSLSMSKLSLRRNNTKHSSSVIYKHTHTPTLSYTLDRACVRNCKPTWTNQQQQKKKKQTSKTWSS